MARLFNSVTWDQKEWEMEILAIENDLKKLSRFCHTIQLRARHQCFSVRLKKRGKRSKMLRNRSPNDLFR
jgi:hypothetical protein